MIERRRFQNGSLMLVKNKTTPDTWFLRFYEDRGEKRVYRRQRIGTVREFPHRRDAEKAVLALRGKINTEVSSPETVNDLLTHYQKNELTPARKAYASIQITSPLRSAISLLAGDPTNSARFGPCRLKNGSTRCHLLRRPRRRSRVSSPSCIAMRYVTSGSL